MSIQQSQIIFNNHNDSWKKYTPPSAVIIYAKDIKGYAELTGIYFKQYNHTKILIQ